MDHLSKAQRSVLMARVKQIDTEPELLVRKALHRRGLRYVLADRRLPGRPDLSFPRYKAVVFIHGCYWHGHDTCTRGRPSKSNVEYWSEKIATNRSRDARNEEALRQLGWRVFVVWLCEIRSVASRDRITNELADQIKNASID